VREPNSSRSDYLSDGDGDIHAVRGARRLDVNATVSGSTPGDWELCVASGDPDAGACVAGTGTLHAVANETMLAGSPEVWRVWVTIGQGVLPANAGAAMQVDWSAHVGY
jgi:hypothetical protein